MDKLKNKESLQSALKSMLYRYSIMKHIDSEYKTKVVGSSGKYLRDIKLANFIR